MIDQVRQKYKDTEISGTAFKDAAGNVNTENYNESSFPFLREVTSAHETFHKVHHIPHTDDKFEKLPNAKFTEWFLGNEVETHEKVNLKRVTARITKLEKLVRDCKAKETLQ